MRRNRRTTVLFFTGLGLIFFPALFSTTAQEAIDGPVAPEDEQTGDLPGEAPEQPAPEPRAAPTELERWRDTLQFGINSAVAELLPQLTRNRERDLADEVVDLFATSNNSSILRGAAEFLRELEITAGHDRAMQLVQEYYDRPSDVITPVLRYLRETNATIDGDTRDTLVEISRLLPPARAVAAVRLYAQADTSIDDLIALYHEPGIPEDVQGQILVEMGTRGDTRAFDFVSEIIGTDEEATTVLQRFAIDTLGKLGDDRAVPIILRQFGSNDALTRAYAVNALTSFDTPETNRALRGALRDEFWRVRVAALQTVADREMDEAAPAALYMMRRDPERPVRQQAIRTVVALDTDEGWEAIWESIESSRGNLEERSLMVELALRHNPGDSLPAINRVIESEWDTDNSRILDTIGRTVSMNEIDHPALSEVVERLLNHPHFILQVYAIRAVGYNGLSQFTPILNERAGEGNHQLLRTAASRALDRMTNND